MAQGNINVNRRTDIIEVLQLVCFDLNHHTESLNYKSIRAYKQVTSFTSTFLIGLTSGSVTGHRTCFSLVTVIYHLI